MLNAAKHLQRVSAIKAKRVASPSCFLSLAFYLFHFFLLYLQDASSIFLICCGAACSVLPPNDVVDVYNCGVCRVNLVYCQAASASGSGSASGSLACSSAMTQQQLYEYICILHLVSGIWYLLGSAYGATCNAHGSAIFNTFAA